MQRVTWWPGDYLRDTGDLSLVEHGAYRVLLDHYYSTDGRLKADQAALFRICRAMTEEEQAAVGKVVRLFFTTDAEGNLHNKKADEIIAENTAYIAAAKEAGKKGSAKRWGNGKPIGSPTATPIGNPMRTPIAASTSTNTKNHSAVFTAPDGFLQFWSVWPKSPRKVGRAPCLAKWVANGLEDRAAEIIAHVNALKTTKQWRDGFDPAPLTYLNQRRWEDGPVEERKDEKRFVI